MRMMDRAKELVSQGKTKDEVAAVLTTEFPEERQHIGNILYKLIGRPEELKRPITQEEIDAINHYFPPEE